MPTTATAPKDALADRKVSGLLDDLIEDTDDAIVAAKALQRSAAIRYCSSSALSNYDRSIRALDTGSDATESERGNVLAGKAKDLKKFKSLLQTQLDALTNLQELNGRFEVLEDADIGAMIVAIIAVLHELMAPASEMGRLERELASIRAKLEAAIKQARDTKVKAMLTAGLTAASAIAAPLGVAASASVFVGKLVANQVIDATLQGREDSSVKEVWGYTATLSKTAVSLGAVPKSFGPLTDLISGVVDVGECFAAERDKQALFDQLSRFMADYKKAAATFIAQSDKIAAACADAQATLKDAIAAIGSFKPTKGSYHAVLKMI